MGYLLWNMPDERVIINQDDRFLVTKISVERGVGWVYQVEGIDNNLNIKIYTDSPFGYAYGDTLRFTARTRPCPETYKEYQHKWRTSNEF